MDLFASQVPSLFVGISAGANRSTPLTPEAWSTATVREVLTLDAQRRPYGQLAASRGYAARYLGDQRGIIDALLRVRYPRSADRMHPAPIGYTRMWARADSGGYQQEPDRYLVDVEGERIASDDMQAASDTQLERARISEVAPEAERRAATGTKCAVVHVAHIPALDLDAARATLTHYWPHDAVVVCHPAYPSEESASIFVALRQVGAIDSEGMIVDRWLCYRRDYTDDDRGMPASWGTWQVATWTDKDASTTWEEYEGTLVPAVVLRLEPGDGGFWPAPDVDSMRSADQLNMSRANEDLILGLQAHSHLVISDDTYDEQMANISPDGVTVLKSGSSAQYLTPAPAFDAMKASIEETQRAIAAARGNDPNAYAARTGAPESGIARLVAKFPHELTLRERREALRRFDERLSRTILDVVDTFDPDAPSFGLEVRCRTDLAPSVVFEDPSAKLARAQQLLDAGAISSAEFVVEVGRYRTLEEAKRAGYSDDARLRIIEDAVSPDVLTAMVPAVDDVDVASLALNGAQVSSLIELVGLIAGKNFPAETGREIILAAFPAILPAVVDKMLAPLRTFTPPIVDGVAAPAPVVEDKVVPDAAGE